jgi:hypothetical protein
MKMRCQSCGMPLDKDPKNGGTNADGSVNSEYCSYCYKDGAFIGNMTAKEMQNFVKAKLREMGYGRFMSWLMASDIPYLKRWKRS